MLQYRTINIYFHDNLMNGKSTQFIIKNGINFFLQGGRIFPHLTVQENLGLAGQGLKKKYFENRKKQVTAYFDLFQNENDGRLNLQASYLVSERKRNKSLWLVQVNLANSLFFSGRLTQARCLRYIF